MPSKIFLNLLINFILFHLKTQNFCVGFPFASGAYLLLIKLNIYHQSYTRSLQLGKAKRFLNRVTCSGLDWFCRSRSVQLFKTCQQQ